MISKNKKFYYIMKKEEEMEENPDDDKMVDIIKNNPFDDVFFETLFVMNVIRKYYIEGYNISTTLSSGDVIRLDVADYFQVLKRIPNYVFCAIIDFGDNISSQIRKNDKNKAKWHNIKSNFNKFKKRKDYSDIERELEKERKEYKGYTELEFKNLMDTLEKIF